MAVIGAGIVAAVGAISWGVVAANVAISVGLALVQRALTPTQVFKQTGPRLGDAQISSSAEGTSINRLIGRSRMGGQLIYTTRFLERKKTKKKKSGGKGGGGGSETKTTTYTYTVTLAVAFCEGGDNVTLGRVWMDGKITDLSNITYRFYAGDDTQLPDEKIESIEGVGNVPAYRGVCYIVFENLLLTSFGNRIPQIAAEIIKPIESTDDDDMEKSIESVVLIPGVTEHGHSTQKYTRRNDSNKTEGLNVSSGSGDVDLVESLNQLETAAVNLGSVALTVSWIGDSLNALDCTVRPMVEAHSRRSHPNRWRSSEVFRTNADTSSSYLGTPSDFSLREGIQDIKDRGLRLMFSPVIAFDTQRLLQFPVVNPTPHVDVTGWTTTLGTLGRIFNSGMSNKWAFYGPDSAELLSYQDVGIPSDALSSVDAGTESVTARWDQGGRQTGLDEGEMLIEFLDELDASMGSADGPGLQSVTPGTSVSRNHTVEIPPGARKVRLWIHQIRNAGDNADGHINRIELFISTDNPEHRLRHNLYGNPTNFIGDAAPDDFEAWAAVPTDLFPEDYGNIEYTGPVEWSYRRMILHYAKLVGPFLESGDVFLIGSGLRGLTESSALWGTALATLATDVKSMLPAGVLVSYAADWKEYNHANLAPVWSSADVDFIGINNYMPLTDWRSGDETYTRAEFMSGIESGEYYDYVYDTEQDRIDGTQTAIVGAENRQKDIRSWLATNYPTKDIWFTELGCAAVDKGGNRPDSFYDPNSTDSFLPDFSTGTPNETAQRLYIEATIKYWSEDGLVDPANIFVYGWDIRPYPYFPGNVTKWVDAEGYSTGNWLNGRLGSASLSSVVKELAVLSGVPESNVDVGDLDQLGIRVRGLLVGAITSARAVLQNVMQTYLFDALETNGTLKFVPRISPDRTTVSIDEIITENGVQTYTKTRLQETDLPNRTNISFLNEFRNYHITSVDGHNSTGFSEVVRTFESLCVLNDAYARSLADILTHEDVVARDSLSFKLPLSRLELEPGDVFDIEIETTTQSYRIESVVIGEDISIESVRYNPDLYETVATTQTPTVTTGIVVFGSSTLVFAELPLVDPQSPNLWSPRLIGTQDPWPGGINVYEDDDSGGFDLNNQLEVSSLIGETLTDLNSGVTSVWDTENSVEIRLYSDTEQLSSESDLSVLNGSNVLAILTPSGEWEILQFADAVLNESGTYTVSRLLRGKLGTEYYMGDPTPAGAQVIVIDIENLDYLNGSVSRLNSEKTMRFGPSSYDIDDVRYETVDVTPRGVALRPYAPVRLTQTQNGADIDLTWLRRTRFEGDSWETTTLPLHEDFERFEIDIMDGETVVRTVTVDNSTEYTYLEADQITDFGSAQASIVWTVYQISNLYGRGTPANG